MRGIQSATFNDLCFNFATSVLKNERETKEIAFREVGQLLDLLHPEHPFSLMKFLFKLYQEDDKTTNLRNLDPTLQGISSGKLQKIVHLLRSSLQYIREQGVHNVIKITLNILSNYFRLKRKEFLTFEQYLRYVQHFGPMKAYS